MVNSQLIASRKVWLSETNIRNPKIQDNPIVVTSAKIVATCLPIPVFALLDWIWREWNIIKERERERGLQEM